ncbi:type IV inositol polyphosphate 5-phosphatase 3 isoform X3 [Castanea sativa]
MKQRSKQHQQELFWPRVVMRKWLNITTQDSDFSADEDEDENEEEEEKEVENDDQGQQQQQHDTNNSNPQAFGQLGRRLRPRGNRGYGGFVGLNDALPRLRRRKSETFRAQYINSEELRICVGTWNVGGKLPPDNLDIDDWLEIDEPADIYVIGLQEIVPLNAGNIFGAESNRPVPKWENFIRETLNQIRPITTKIKSFSDPPSPSRFKPSDDIPGIEEEVLFESDSDVGEEVHPFDEDSNGFDGVKDKPITEKSTCLNSGVPDSTGSAGLPGEQELERQFSSPKRLDRLNCLRTEDSVDVETSEGENNGKLNRMLSGTERIGLSWPERPLNLLSQHVLERPNSLRPIRSFSGTKSFRTYSSFKSTTNEVPSQIALLAEIDLESLFKRKRRSSFVRIVSKQMVGIFLTIWVRRSLRRHIQNVKVSTVGVGVMGYIGNKGSVSVSMSIYQTLFCFICTHLTAGEKDGDELKRNADVHEIHRRTHFHSYSDSGLPKSILDHERIIWLGDLNYRINLSYEKTRELISKKDWSKLVESDQLLRELKKGRAFDGWLEGTLKFPPTYKYEINSEKYYGDDPKSGRRTPAWCDRILSYGKGMKLLSYRRAELKLSDHRPVTATYMAEVEVFSPKKLQRALTFTDAEIENDESIVDMGIEVGIGCLRLEEDIPEEC